MTTMMPQTFSPLSRLYAFGEEPFSEPEAACNTLCTNAPDILMKPSLTTPTTKIFDGDRKVCAPFLNGDASL